MLFKHTKTMKRSQESILQESCFTWFRLQYPKLERMFYAIPNGGSRSKKAVKTKDGRTIFVSLEGKRMKAEGVKAGVSDTFLSVPRKGFHGLYIEFKWGKNTLSAEQKAFLEDVKQNGYQTAVVYSFDQFTETINTYLGYGNN